ncbi:hypothetical protein NMY22_g5977 [Coprinellus aureogranulatus]|nr:hypothetical protein NMY22_g5977 [Coprinellus aureogranulatus]
MTPDSNSARDGHSDLTPSEIDMDEIVPDSEDEAEDISARTGTSRAEVDQAARRAREIRFIDAHSHWRDCYFKLIVAMNDQRDADEQCFQDVLQQEKAEAGLAEPINTLPNVLAWHAAIAKLVAARKAYQKACDRRLWLWLEVREDWGYPHPELMYGYGEDEEEEMGNGSLEAMLTQTVVVGQYSVVLRGSLNDTDTPRFLKWVMLLEVTVRRHYASVDLSDGRPAPPPSETDSEEEREDSDIAMDLDPEHRASTPPERQESNTDEDEDDPMATDDEQDEEDPLLEAPTQEEQGVLQVEDEVMAAAQAERQQVVDNVTGYRYQEHPLSEEESDDIRAFQLRLFSNMPRSSFNFMRHTFRNKLQISSEWVMLKRMADLAGVELQHFDCCINSCMAYTGDHADKDKCDHCKEDRRDGRGKAKRVFSYLPLIPQLRGIYTSNEMAALMHYREKFDCEGPEIIKDVFDGAHYQRLLKKPVSINGEEQQHTYFHNPQDVAFSVCTDGFLLFGRKRRGPTATPILIQNYNLPPHLRTHFKHLICVGVIPGPKHPKDIASFRYPLEQECILLAGKGVVAYDASTKKNFRLRAYQIFELGDIIAIEASLGLKGHNSSCPCRSCLLKGIRILEGTNKVYYIPLRIPKEHHPTNAKNAARQMEEVKVRSHKTFAAALEKMEAAGTKAEEEQISRETGVRRAPAFGSVGSIDFGRSAPWDWMHLFLENIVPNLVDLWSGRFKGLDTGSEDYEIEPHIWEEIAEETQEAVKDIPSGFVRDLKHIITDRSLFTAEAWCFWFIYLAPILLRGRFKKEKYYRHMCDLVDIMKATLKYSITKDELDDLEDKIDDWVKRYERYYYQYSEQRLPTCVLTIHGLLHIVNDIRNCGPSWTTWTFFMERFCGLLKQALKSKRFPWANLTKRALHVTWLNQLIYRYDLEEELSMPRSDYRYRDADGDLTRNERRYDGYPDHIMVTPHNKSYQPDKDTRNQVAYYWHLVTQRGKTTIEKALPKVMASWGKIRMDSFKTTVRGSKAITRHDTGRNSSFVRYATEYDGPDGAQISVIGYGQLVQVLVCPIQANQQGLFGNYAGKTHLLALVIPCQTHGADARNTLVEYTQNLTLLAMDVRSIKAVDQISFAKRALCSLPFTSHHHPLRVSSSASMSNRAQNGTKPSAPPKYQYPRPPGSKWTDVQALGGFDNVAWSLILRAIHVHGPAHCTPGLTWKQQDASGRRGLMDAVAEATSGIVDWSKYEGFWVLEHLVKQWCANTKTTEKNNEAKAEQYQATKSAAGAGQGTKRKREDEPKENAKPAAKAKSGPSTTVKPAPGSGSSTAAKPPPSKKQKVQEEEEPESDSEATVRRKRKAKAEKVLRSFFLSRHR